MKLTNLSINVHGHTIRVVALMDDGSTAEGEFEVSEILSLSDRLVTIARTAMWNRIAATTDAQLRQTMEAVIGLVIPKPPKEG